MGNAMVADMVAVLIMAWWSFSQCCWVAKSLNVLEVPKDGEDCNETRIKKPLVSPEGSI